MVPVFIHAFNAWSALGTTAQQMREHLFSAQDLQPLTQTAQYSHERMLPLGCLPAGTVLPTLDFAPAHQRSRNNALAWGAMQPLGAQIEGAISRWGAARVALVVGTSTSGVQEGELAAAHRQARGEFPPGFDYALQEMGNVATFLAQHLGIQGPVHTISTACSSGAKTLASAARLLNMGVVDAVVAGGVDALCAFTVAGFSALEAVSSERCNPLSVHRKGINLGEGAAFFVLSREAGAVRLAGWGETQDAYHMSAPDPTGQGAELAMQLALRRAGIAASEIDYVNLHGTATAHNDAMESLAVERVLGAQVPVSSTKPMTGHTLAAAGALEAAIALHVLLGNPKGLLPVHWWDAAADSAVPALHVVQPCETLGHAPKAVLSNSFAFGGSNCTLVLACE